MKPVSAILFQYFVKLPCYIIAALLIVLCLSITANGQKVDDLKWDKVSSLPPIDSLNEINGLAGHFAGIHRNVLILAGGTGFAKGARPWNGGKRFWNKHIFVLKHNNNGTYEWLHSDSNLPFSRAYGSSVSLPEGILCIGGADTSGKHAVVFLLSWDEAKQRVNITDYPDLPISLAYSSAALIGQEVYVAGGETDSLPGVAQKAFYKLDLKKRGAPGFTWEKLQAWPGPGRVMPVLAAQNNGHYNCIYLFSGRKAARESEELLFDAYVYDPKKSSWKKLADVHTEKSNEQKCLSGASSVSVGLNHILVFGGADSRDHRAFRNVLDTYRKSTPGITQDSLKRALDHITDGHSGFSKDVMAYHTLTDKWVKVGESERGIPVATQAVWWNNSIIIPGGEIAPALRSPGILKVQLSQKESALLNIWDYLLISLYFAAILYIGYRYKKNVKTTSDYYKAGGRIPGWASGVAIFGTLLSAITFLTTPAKTYNESWIYFLPTISSLVVAPLIVRFIIPEYFKINVTTAYEYLESRFNVAVRMLGSLSFICFQIAKFGVMLLLPALAISAITGIDVMVCIIVIGLFSTIYGTLGGIEAVVWTEVLQVFIFLLAAVLSIVVVALKLDGGAGEIFTVNRDFGKFNFVNWDLSFSEITIFVAISYWIGGGLVPYISDQTVIQKYLVTKDAKSASRGVWLNGILIVASSVLFFSIGSALFAYYHAFPDKLNPALPTQESIYPWFIVNELPSGIRGVVVAGIFAVAMSTISSTMNSMSAAAVTDYLRFRPLKPKQQLWAAKGVSAGFGIIGTAIAAIMFIYEVGSLWDMIRRITGLLTGGLAGLFLLGIFTKRANHIGAIAGFLGSAVVQYIVSVHTQLHFMVYSLTGMVSCFGIGYFFSLLFPNYSPSKGQIK